MARRDMRSRTRASGAGGSVRRGGPTWPCPGGHFSSKISADGRESKPGTLSPRVSGVGVCRGSFSGGLGAVDALGAEPSAGAGEAFADGGWEPPSREVFVFSDIQGDPGALIRSLVMSGAVEKTGPLDEDLELTARGTAGVLVFCGDLLGRGPSNVRVLGSSARCGRPARASRDRGERGAAGHAGGLGGGERRSATRPSPGAGWSAAHDVDP